LALRDSSDAFPAPFQALIDRTRTAVDGDALATARVLAGEATAWAAAHGDQEARDRALCNHISLCIAGDCDQDVAGLRPVLMRSRSATTRYLAAYNLSIHYDRCRRYDKSLFYAQIALDHAQQTDDPVALLNCWNRIGNVQIIQSFFLDACTAYRRGAALLSGEPGPEHAVLGANIGYCLLMLGRLHRGLGELLTTRSLIQRLGLPQLEARIGLRLSLCYASIEFGNIGLAREHGRRALAQGERSSNGELIQKALYLLGEVEKKAGDEDRAFRCFARLQTTYYPDHHDLPDLLMAVESHRLVNLRA